MTLLSVAQDVCDVIGLTRPTAIVAAQDQLARQILGLAKKTLEELGRMDWPVLEVPYTFNTVVNQETYVLPADWGREVGDTVYAASQYSQLRGSLTPGDWQRQRDTISPQVGKYRFRVFGLPLRLHISQTPQVIEAITLEYQTTYRVQQVDTSYKNTFFADSDISLMPEELLKKGLEWRLRHVKGLDYSEEFDDYEMSRAQWLAQALSMGSMAVAYRYGADGPETLALNIRENGFG